MGSSQSTNIKNTMDIVNQNMTSIMNSNKNSTTQVATAENEFIINNTGNFSCDKISLGQKITADVKLSGFANSVNSADVANAMKSAVEQAAKSSQESVQSFLSTTFGNQKTNVQVQAELKNIVEQSIKNETFNECVQNFKGLNRGVINNTGNFICKTLNAPQDIAIDMLAQCSTDALTETLLKNTQIAEGVQKSEAEQVVENKGVGEAISGILSGYGMILIGVALVILVVIGVIIYIVSRGGSKVLKETAGVIGSVANIKPEDVKIATAPLAQKIAKALKINRQYIL